MWRDASTVGRSMVRPNRVDPSVFLGPAACIGDMSAAAECDSGCRSAVLNPMWL